MSRPADLKFAVDVFDLSARRVWPKPPQTERPRRDIAAVIKRKRGFYEQGFNKR